ncbi:MAG: hypothetical protein IIC60_07970 [Proteobacteria bacterium]|nr:hypothetical protein [Pseudomonadota bacterium]
MVEATAATSKVILGSPEWLALARVVLEELVATHGKTGKSFSVSETFTDATVAAWHFFIIDKTVSVAEGALDDADMTVSVSYERALKGAKIVYPAFLGWLLMPIMRVIRLLRNQPNPPSYLMQLHNRLAVVTQ